MKNYPLYVCMVVVLLVFTSCVPASKLASPAASALSPTFPSATATVTKEPLPSSQELLVPSPTATTSIPTSTAAESAQPDPKELAPVTGMDVTAFPDPALFSWNLVFSGLESPVDLSSPPDGSDRLFLLEQAGVIRIFQDGSLLPDPFIDIRQKVQSKGNEQGLLGIAFDPDYAKSGTFYINYTGLQGIGDTVIARYQVSANDPNRADEQSERILLTVKQPYANHNGGGLAFGPDGYLYIGLGDGGSANDPQGNGQSRDTLLGKLLRLDVSSGDPYAIPSDNPFSSGGGKGEIWAYGLRNPWRFSFDRMTGDLYIADVGQNQWEEVDYLPAGSSGGANFGWNFREGSHSFQGRQPAETVLVDPIFEYQHDLGCSITGGYVYRGKGLQEFNGVYLVSDFCSGRVWGILKAGDGNWQVKELFQTGFLVTSFGQDSNGEIYLLDRSSGSVYRLEKR